MKDVPVFLDFEASSLASASYPIEVAWNLPNGSIESYLISPAETSRWTDWSLKAQEIHGISPDELVADGKIPAWVCRRMNEQLAGRIVYTDAPDYDGMWLAELFSEYWDEPKFELRHIDGLLVSIVCPEITGRVQGLARIEEIKEEARRIVGKQHRAAWDVQYLIELWKLAVDIGSVKLS